MVFYVPGTEETDAKKQNMSLQQLGGGLTTAVAATAINTAAITTNTAAITSLQTAGQGLVNSGGSLAVSLSIITASLGADVALNNIVNYFDGPSVAQGTSGTWFAIGTVSVVDTTGAANISAKLWDGTTVFASAFLNTLGVGQRGTVSLSGFISSPAGNIRISCRDSTSTSGAILFNASGNSKDSTITAIRIA